MRIALTYTGTEAKHQNYVNWLKQTDEYIEIVTLSAEKDNLFELENCDGLVFSGGTDINPKIYHNGLSYPNSPSSFDDKRDVLEIAAFELAQFKKIPILAICRGLQLVNCLLGGSLKQDLGSSNPIHRAVVEPETKRQFDTAHGVHILPESILFEVNMSDRGIVNSAHHQAAESISESLVATAKSDDGIVEALEWKDVTDKSFLLCVQWHPERMYEFGAEQSPLSLGIRNRFIDACVAEKDTVDPNHFSTF